MGESFTKEAYEIVYKDPRWKGEATKYEENLAAKLFHMSYTKAAVKTALGKISRVLTTYYGDGGKQLPAKEQLEDAAALNDLAGQAGGADQQIQINKTLVEALMQEKRDNTGAGQVRKVLAGDEKGDGTQFTQDQADMRNMQRLDDVINGDGNLREQMTLLYNGMFINGGKSKEQIRNGVSFKGLLQGAKDIHDEDQRDALGLNFDLLGGLDHFQNGEDVFDTYSLARDLEKREEERAGKGNRLTRWWRGVKRAWDAAILNSFRRSSKKKEEQQGLGMEHYQQLGIAPSERERFFSMTVGKDGEEQIAWKEGTAYYTPKKTATAKGMLQTAGTSGTTLRMLGAYKLMGASQKELLDFRLALIAWMVSSHDHSLYEVLKGSHNAGVRGTESLEEAAVMYTNIDPLDTETLRENFAENKQFPHEVIYKMQLNDLTEARKKREAKIGRKTLREDRILENDNLAIQKDVMDELFDRHTKEKKLLEKKIVGMINRLLNAKNAFKNDTDGSQRRAVEEELMAAQQRLFFMSEDLELITQKRMLVTKKKQDVELLPELTLFAKSAVTQGVDAMKLQAQDLALNIYTTGAYMTMNVGKKWGGFFGKRKLTDSRVDEKKFGSYQSSYKEETKDSKLLDQIYALTRLSARTAQDALEERGGREPGQENEADYMHAASVNTFRGEKNSGGGYQTAGAEYDTKSLTSTSKRIEKALMYFGKSAEKAGYDNSVLALYQLTGKGSVDITKLSKVANEEEVLVPAGTRFRVEKSLVKNVSVEALKKDPKNIVSDTVSDDALAAEFALNEDGKVNYGGIKHVNVVKLVEVDGPGARRRRVDDATRWVRGQIRESLAQ